MDSFVAVQIKTAVSNFIVSFYFFELNYLTPSNGVPA